jgi:hypothetical protein
MFFTKKPFSFTPAVFATIQTVVKKCNNVCLFSKVEFERKRKETKFNFNLKEPGLPLGSKTH